MPRRDIRLIDESGQPAGCDWDERIVVKDAFEERIQATECTFESLIIEDRTACAEQAGRNAATVLDIVAIPFVQYLTRRNAHAQLKGFGETPIGGEVHRLLPQLLPPSCACH